MTDQSLKPPEIPGLYIHVPFCQSICPYCDFATCIAPESRHSRWLHYLQFEIHGRRTRGTRYRTLYLGGGTPSLLTSSVMVKLLESLHLTFRLADLKEVCLEANPADLSREKLAIFWELGFRRLSIGVQSFNENHLRRLGRTHSPLEARESISRAADHGFNVNVDLIFGIPEQSIAEARWDLKYALDLPQEHISYYGLTIEPKTPFARWSATGKLPALPDEYDEMYTRGVEMLERKGFLRYEVSNFAKPGAESLHNTQYWNHSAYHGYGPGAHSFQGTLRTFNSKRVSEYERWVDSGSACKSGNSERLSPNQLLGEALLLGLRTREGIAPTKLRSAYNAEIRESCFDKWIERRMIRRTGHGNMVLEGQGWLHADTIAADIFSSLEKRISGIRIPQPVGSQLRERDTASSHLP